MTSIEENKELIERYPFLMPIDGYTGKLNEGYDYSYTLLDDMPKGWRKRFGITMCEEIRNALILNNIPLEEYHISQIKEKWGTLRWYDSNSCNDVWDIIDKYEEVSKSVCIRCGKDATHMTEKGWIEPLCDECDMGE